MSVSVALFSGGHDSLCSTHLAMTTGLATEVAHVNTGIGVEETREFVRRVCRDKGWPLTELHPPVSYEEIVLAEGFPGPAAHGFMYRRLKERPLRALARERRTRRGELVTLVTGVRREESKRRMGTVRAVRIADGFRWLAPILEWTRVDCHDYMEVHGLPRNPVVDLLHMSGECLCGAFARPGELHEIATWYPETAARIVALQERVEAAGLVACAWGQRPDPVHRDQARLFPILPLCQSCPSGDTLRETA